MNAEDIATLYARLAELERQIKIRDAIIEQLKDEADPLRHAGEWTEHSPNPFRSE